MRGADKSYFEHYLAEATVSIIMTRNSTSMPVTDLPGALFIEKKVRELGEELRERGREIGRAAERRAACEQ